MYTRLSRHDSSQFPHMAGIRSLRSRRPTMAGASANVHRCLLIRNIARHHLQLEQRLHFPQSRSQGRSNTNSERAVTSQCVCWRNACGNEWQDEYWIYAFHFCGRVLEPRLFRNWGLDKCLQFYSMLLIVHSNLYLSRIHLDRFSNGTYLKVLSRAIGGRAGECHGISWKTSWHS